MTTRPVVSIVRVAGSGCSPWDDVARARLARHTIVPHERIDCGSEASFGAAVNRSAARASAEYLVVMRADTLVGPDWLEPLLATCSQRDAMVTPCVRGLDGTVVDTGYLAGRNGDLFAYGRGAHRVRSLLVVRPRSLQPFPCLFRGAACRLPRRRRIRSGG